MRLRRFHFQQFSGGREPPDFHAMIRALAVREDDYR
jgi:hypothetical protein